MKGPAASGTSAVPEDSLAAVVSGPLQSHPLEAMDSRLRGNDGHLVARHTSSFPRKRESTSLDGVSERLTGSMGGGCFLAFAPLLGSIGHGWGPPR